MANNQDYVTIIIPFASTSEWNPLIEADVRAMIDLLGNPADATAKEQLDKLAIVHFMSINVIGADETDRRAFLLIEATVDGPVNTAIDAIAGAIGDQLSPIIAKVCGVDGKLNVQSLLQRHQHPMSRDPLGWPGRVRGFPFRGLPGISVKQINANKTLYDAAARAVDALRRAAPTTEPQTIFASVREGLARNTIHGPALKQRLPALAFAERYGASWIEYERNFNIFSVGLKLFAAQWQWLSLLLVPPFLIACGLAAWATSLWSRWSWMGLLETLMLAVFPAVLITITLLGATAWAFYNNERANKPADIDPDPARLAEIMQRENAPGVLQNHMTSVTHALPGLLRRLTLLLAWQVVSTASGGGLFRPGFLANIGTIHSARWIQLPGTDRLIFVSNYDASWESYLEDFITKSAVGATAIWSNARGFPRTSWLFFKGAEDGDRFKRFARRSMQPTGFWYSAYPTITCEQIRRHAIIISGLQNHELIAKSPSDAEAWIDLFGAVPRPEYGLEYEEIQALMFGGMKYRKRSVCLALSFGSAKPAPNRHPYRHVQQWLAGLDIRYGNKRGDGTVCNIAFSANGLRKLGLDRELSVADCADPPTAIDQPGFPATFALGMHDATRKRILGDPGNASLDWCDDTTDAVLLLYPETDQDGSGGSDRAEGVFRAAIAAAEAAGLHIIERIDTELTETDRAKLAKDWLAKKDRPSGPAIVEPFGFVDGISQPKVRGFPGVGAAHDPIHSVEPGEFILGYIDNRGYFPPSPTLSRDFAPIGMDAQKLLPSTPANQPQRYPDFGRSALERGSVRDFGRNGSYLVIRQLAQDVDGFNKQIDRLASQHIADPDNPHRYRQARTREWLAAKMVGRWKSGSSLVENPFSPRFDSGRRSDSDNDFLFRDLDPQGKRCPFGAHMRRAFPRDSLNPNNDFELSVTNRHRLLRRGRTYTKAGMPAGTLFMCFNADLERQFEFVQQTWLSSPVFHGLDAEVDPLVTHGNGATVNGNLTVPGPAAPLHIEGLARYVELKGGGYFFMPSRHAIWFLAGELWADERSGSALPSI